MKNLLLFALALLVLPYHLLAQISIEQGGTFNLPCGGTESFTSPNPGGNYGPNEVHQITVCADGGNAITLLIAIIGGDTWDVADGDVLTIYDGPDTSAPLIGSYNSANAPDGLSVASSIENISGCLTIVFLSDGENEGAGWTGLLECGIGWQPYEIELSSNPIDGENEEGYIDICLNETVDFTVTGDYPYSDTGGDGYEQSDDNMFFTWDMGDGTTFEGEGLNSVSHTFTGQFGYNVIVNAVDPLGQFRVDTLKVRVSIPPIFDTAGPLEDPICLGESTTLVGGYIDPNTVAGFQEGIGSFFVGGLSSGQFQLPDGSGAQYQGEVFVGGVDPSVTISDVSDFLSLCVNIEHSFLGDLEMGLMCPNGTMINIFNGYGGEGMFEPGFGGGTTFLGNAMDAGGGPGEPFEYCFSMDAVWGTMGDELDAGNTVAVDQGNAMAEGTYLPEESFESFVGCPVAGVWTLVIQDNLFIDDGYVFDWTITLNPALYPDPEFYSPEVVDAAWQPNPDIVETNELDVVVQPQDPGLNSYVFTVTDNFGCSYDTTVTVLVAEPPIVDAGENLFLACSDAQLDGTVNGQSLPQCSQAEGLYTLCYENSVDSIRTFCPDNPGDGVTFLTIEILEGQVENFFDSFIVYDGDNIGAPILADLEGNIGGLTFTATNDGCLTVRLISDGSVSCESGNFGEIEYAISCSPGTEYIVSWTPEDFLADPSLLNTEIIGLTESQVYTLTAAPAIAPQCAVSDEVEVIIGDPPSPGEDAEITFCIDGPVEDLFTYLGGEPDESGVWTNPDGSDGDGSFNPALDPPGDYVYSIPGCDVEAVLTVEVANYSVEVSEDVTLCIGGSEVLSVTNPEADIEYTWSSGELGESITVDSNGDDAYFVVATYGPGCESTSELIAIEVLDPLSLTINPGAIICPGDSIFIGVESASGGLAPYDFVWTWDGGSSIETEGTYVFPEDEGNWCCTMTDACETPAAVQCIFIGQAESIDPTFQVDTLGGCIPLMVSFTGNADNPDIIEEALWEFGNGATSSFPEFALHTYQSQGQYSITYTATTVDGCVFTHTENDLISVFNQPSAGFNFSPQTAVLPDTRVQFNNYSLAADDYFWLFNETDTVFEFDPLYTFPDQPGLYPVTLYAYNDWGCIDSLTRQVYVVEEFTMFIPNAFTPDGDGVNDVWRFQGIDVDEAHFELMIFDRWGEVVHRTSNFSEGWNGNYNNGDYYVPDGVYIYRIETRALSSGDNKVVSGHVSIVR